MIYPYVKLMRPSQWTKNLLAFAPAFFAGALLDAETFAASAGAFAAFCLAASAVYILNDVRDCAHDAKHPRKCKRPLPSGAATVPLALLVALLLAGGSLSFALWLPALLPVLLAYLALNLAYTLVLKRVAVLDIILVAFFYVLRIAAGGAAAGIELSPWIILATFFLALFLICAKRRGEAHRKERRAVLEQYAPETLSALFSLSAALALASYGLWSVLAHPGTLAVYSTIPVAAVLFRMMNFLYLHPEEGETPEVVVFKDGWVLALTIVWAAGMWLVFYA